MKLETETQWRDAEKGVFCRICEFESRFFWATDRAQGICESWDEACAELEDSFFEEDGE